MSLHRLGQVCVVLGALSGFPASAAIVTFQEGSAGYTGTRDTYLEENSPTTDYAAASTVRWDADHPGGTGLKDYVLLRFEEIMGAGSGRIPPGANVTSAFLSYTVTNPGNPGTVHEALLAWSESTTFGSFCGAQCDPTQIGPLVATAPGATVAVQSVDVTSSVRAWANGTPNLGWIFVPDGTDGVEFASREFVTLPDRPRLVVTLDEPPPVTVLRQPYLQLGTPGSMTLVWRTDVPTNSRVRYGTTLGLLDRSVESSVTSTDHAVTLTGLAPAARYYYDVGSTAGPHAGGTAEHYFDTSPPAGSSTPFRVWVVGDSGLGNLAQAQVRDAMLAATGSHPPDLFLHMGDIAYYSGTDSEFTAYHFTPYRDILRHTVMWPTLGNHEGMSTVSGAPGPSAGPYYDAFVLPTGGEAGGESSGTEAYYSFDYANAHFVCLNSYQVVRSATGAMAAWLEADLEANTQPWVIAFWHHPPYTHGTHNSDTETAHVEMRQNLLPILEAAGVDLVLGGHSHSYERSYLIDGTYATPTPDRATLLAQGHILDSGDGNPAGDGPYRKNPGGNAHDGTVYVVAGHGGASTGGSLDHPVMFFSEAVHGSVLLDFNGDTVTLTNVRGTGAVSDTCTIVKRPPDPVVVTTVPSRDAVVNDLPTVEVTFSGAVTGVDAADLTANGSSAASVVAQAPDRYLFHLSAPLPPGIATVVLAPGESPTQRTRCSCSRAMLGPTRSRRLRRRWPRNLRCAGGTS